MTMAGTPKKSPTPAAAQPAKKKVTKKAVAKKTAPKRKDAPAKKAPAPKKAVSKKVVPGKPATKPTRGIPKKASPPSAAKNVNATAIVGKMLDMYPDEHCALISQSPYQLIVQTILAAQSTDANVNKISPALFAKYPTVKSLAEADPEELKVLIHSTGFFNNKAKSLLGMSKKVMAEFGGEIPRTLDELVTLPGVGRKTAWVVLGEYFGGQGIVVDTHVIRVAGRLGLHHEEDPVKIEYAIDKHVPEPKRNAFTNAVTAHGRRVCHARKPNCEGCALNTLCPCAFKCDR